MMRSLWDRYREYLVVDETTGFWIDISRMSFGEGFFADMEPAMQRAYSQMDALEAGAIANPDENRMVGHYWLRDSARAPNAEIRNAVEGTLARVRRFAADVHAGRLRGPRGHFHQLLVIGIGGSALGPQLAASALEGPRDRMRSHFFDNTDPDGIDRTLAKLDGKLDETITIVVSKSGGTKETRNGMLEAERAYDRAKLDFGRHAVAVTGVGSELDKYAEKHAWLARFPMWDWVGGRTSELSAVGLLPAALQGFDIDAMLDGARAMDELTRAHNTRKNPAALLALMWFHATGGRGQKDMVILPYKDRLELFSKYLQQLVMESLGKKLSLDGKEVHQGIAVYGNKGSTDQHAYVQQLRDGVNNFFATFIEVLRDRDGDSMRVEGEFTSGDYLHGFFEGTRRALYEGGRESISLTVPEVNARTLGMLIALYERAVGFYASLVNINAYHQPGVESGKKAAGAVLALQEKVLKYLGDHKATAKTAQEISDAIGAADEVETVWKLLEHMSANPDHGVRKIRGASPVESSYARDLLA